MKLIVNADDFGLTVSVSKGIFEGMQQGIITDASAIVNSPYFSKCAELALSNGIEEMGLHCLLTVGVPLSKPELVKSLVNENGYFGTRQELKERQFDMEEVERELENQIAKFFSSGLRLNHIDTHHGFMNRSDEMMELFIRLAKKYDVPLRNEAIHYGMHDVVERYKTSGIKMTDYLYLNHGTPHHTVNAVLEFLQTAKEKYEYVEMCCHAGYSDDILRKISMLNDDRERELEVCLNNEIRNYIESHDIELISYSKI